MTKVVMEKERKDKRCSIINKKDPWFQGSFLLPARRPRAAEALAEAQAIRRR